MKIGCLGTSVLKSWVEATFKVPYEEQEVIHEGAIIRNEFFPREAFNHVLYPICVKLLVRSTSNESLNSFYRKLRIRTILPVDISSFRTSNAWRYHYRKGDGKDLETFIENTLQIPKHKQRLFINGRRIFSSDIEKILCSDGDRKTSHVVQKLLSPQKNRTSLACTASFTDNNVRFF